VGNDDVRGVAVDEAVDVRDEVVDEDIVPQKTDEVQALPRRSIRRHKPSDCYRFNVA